MSRKILIDSLSDKTRELLTKELQIKVEGSKFSYNSNPTYIYPLDVTDDYVYVPFAYGRDCSKSGIGPFPRPDKETFPTTYYKFEGKLRPKQREVKKEAICHLNNYGSTIVAAYPGFGKCLGYNTPVMLFDGTIKMVQDIEIGDCLMGDNSTRRNVLSICRGEEQMYDIISSKGEKYTVNESHILSLKVSSHKSIYWECTEGYDKRYVVKRFDKEQLCFVHIKFQREEDAIKYRDTITDSDILDIEVKDYLKLSKSIKAKLKGYKVPVVFEEKSVKLDPYFIGLWLGDVSRRDTQIDNEDVKYLKIFAEKNDSVSLGRVVFREGKGDYDTILNIMREYGLIYNSHIPYDYKCNNRNNQLKLLAGLIDSDGYCCKYGYEFVQKRKELAHDIVYVARSLGFAATVKEITKKSSNTNGSYLISIYGENLYQIPVLIQQKISKNRKQKKDHLVVDIQVVPVKERKYYGFTLDGNHRFLLGDFTVTHNTCMAIYMASKVKMKVIIITHRIVLIKQWKASLMKFCPGATVQVLTAKSNKKDCDFYIMNAINVSKHESDYYKDIGMVIVDEVHCIMAEGLSKCMTRLVPRYVLGLSATPYREDGLNILLDLYFGKRKIYRKLFRNHIAYKVQTSFVPTVELAANGRVNWGVILNSQGEDRQRNEMIIRIVKYFPKRVFLILCKRVNQGKYLVQRLTEEGEDVTSLIGKQQEYEQKSRILVGTSSKAGTGFDHPRLDAMIMASEVQAYWIQYLGRVLRTEEVVPLIFDIVDKNPILEKHYKVRRSVYLEHGGRVKDFATSFPDFEMI